MSEDESFQIYASWKKNNTTVTIYSVVFQH